MIFEKTLLGEKCRLKKKSHNFLLKILKFGQKSEKCLTANVKICEKVETLQENQWAQSENVAGCIHTCTIRVLLVCERSF